MNGSTHNQLLNKSLPFCNRTMMDLLNQSILKFCSRNTVTYRINYSKKRATMRTLDNSPKLRMNRSFHWWNTHSSHSVMQRLFGTSDSRIHSPSQYCTWIPSVFSALKSLLWVTHGITQPLTRKSNSPITSSFFNHPVYPSMARLNDLIAIFLHTAQAFPILSVSAGFPWI